jgi:hypothetical protein
VLRIGGGTHFLVVRRTPGRDGHTVRIVGRFDETLPDWEPGSRISPIFPTQRLAEGNAPESADAPIPRFESGLRSWLVFFGPVHPGAIDTPDDLAIFLALGLYNAVAWCKSPDDVVATKSLAAARNLPWEEWELSGDKLVRVQLSDLPVEAALPLAHEITSPISADPAFRPTAREYSTLLASTLSRARVSCLSAVADLAQFDKVFREIIQRTVQPIAKHGALVVTNAALSRYSSQTFAGTSPILETECHFWTHSLLGVGVASLALQNLRRSVDRRIDEVRLIDRILHLANTDAEPTELIGIPSSDGFWLKDFLFDVAQDFTTPTSTDIDEQTLPAITCFSGRDGFRSTEYSLSAPLEVITGCGTTSWTLQTITHEMSHTVVAGVLGALLPSDNDAPELQKTFAILRDPKKATSLLDQVRAFLAFSIWKLNPPANAEETLTLTDLRSRLRRYGQDVNEILTHVFDFLYFYRQDPHRYIESIWASWGVIPNIEHRVQHYVLRSLCALHSNNLRRSGGISISIDQLIDCLVKTKERFPASLYIPEAMWQLEHRRDQYVRQLGAATRLVQFARAFLYSPKAAAIIMSETVAVGGTNTYQFVPFTFSEERIGNPLRFVDENTDHKQPEHRQALWMLVQLAFAEIK